MMLLVRVCRLDLAKKEYADVLDALKAYEALI